DWSSDVCSSDLLVVKPVDGSGGKGIVIGPAATVEELDALRARLQDDPRGWIAQPVVQLSTIPTLVEEGPEPRHVDLRPFALNSGEDVWVLPGGLTRVALPRGEMIVNSSRGGGSKDTWVLAAQRTAAPGRPATAAQAQETGDEGIEDPTDDSYEEFEDPREEPAEERTSEPDPVRSE